MLEEPRAAAEAYISTRAFRYAVPRLYNQLPMDIKCCETVDSLKNKLKTKINREKERSESDFKWNMRVILALLFQSPNSVFKVPRILNKQGLTQVGAPLKAQKCKTIENA